MASHEDIKPFNISVSNELLRDLHAKLELARLPDELDLPAGKEWDWGIPLAVVKPLVEYWRTQYDWRAVEERLNRALPQFTTQVESSKHGTQEVHFVHKRSDNPSATPLLFIHGWPGSFLEVSKIINDLTNPEDPKHPAFHVIAPSLPGFVFSQRASTPGMGLKATAELFDKLMAKLGYKYYIAQGGDWGAMVCRGHAVYHPDTCLGTHSNLNFGTTPTPLKAPLMVLKTVLGFAGLPGGYSKEEIRGIKGAKEFLEIGSGYSKIQGTRPQTLAFGLTDSPVGLLAWIGEKLHVWTDNYPWTPEEFITWVMLYWINGPAGGLRYYKETYGLTDKSTPEGAELHRLVSSWSSTPHGFSWFPKEVVSLPVEWNGINQPLVYAKKHDRGGHFAAWEAPELLVDDIRNFAKILLEKEPRLRNEITRPKL